MERFDFRLKEFGINQSRSAMKVGTDALALGAWTVSLGLQPKRILDVGAGTGILSLMLAQVYPEAYIDAIELDAGAALDARENFERSPWASRLQLYEGNALDFCPDIAYDLIISNPPFYAEDTLTAKGESRQLARREQEGGLGLQSLINCAKAWLSSDGCLCLISPYDRDLSLRQAATESLMYFEELCTLYSNCKSSPVRLLSYLRPLSLLANYQGCRKTSIVLRNEEGDYTRQYKHLTNPFLLD